MFFAAGLSWTDEDKLPNPPVTAMDLPRNDPGDAIFRNVDGGTGDTDSLSRNFAPGPPLPVTEPPVIAIDFLPRKFPGDAIFPNEGAGNGDSDSLFRNFAPAPFEDDRDEKNMFDIESCFRPGDADGDMGGDIDRDADREMLSFLKDGGRYLELLPRVSVGPSEPSLGDKGGGGGGGEPLLSIFCPFFSMLAACRSGDAGEPRGGAEMFLCICF